MTHSPQVHRPADIARMCTVPRTPEEWVFALTYPVSPLKEKLDVLLMDAIDQRAALIAFMQYLDVMNIRAENARIEEWLKERNSLDSYKEMKRQEEAGRPLQLKPDQTVSALEKSLEKVDELLKSLLADSAKMNQEYREVNQQLNVLTKQWDNKQQTLATQFKNELVQQIPALLEDPARQERILNAMKAPAPAKILNINPALVEVLKEPKANILELGKGIENRLNFVRELNVLANVLVDKEEFDPKEFLNKLKLKPKFNIPKLDATDNTNICDAISGICKRNDLQAAMTANQTELEAAKQKREALQKALKIVLPSKKMT